MHVLNVLSLLIQRIGDKVSITPLLFLYLPLDLENNLYFKQLVISNTWTYRFTVRLVMSNKLERCYFIVFIKVKPFAASLSQYLPELWQESGDHNMLRCAIVSTMTHLVEVNKLFWFLKGLNCSLWKPELPPGSLYRYIFWERAECICSVALVLGQTPFHGCPTKPYLTIPHENRKPWELLEMSFEKEHCTCRKNLVLGHPFP